MRSLLLRRVFYNRRRNVRGNLRCACWWEEERVYSLVWDAEREGHEKWIDEERLPEEYKRLSEMLLLCLIIEERVSL